LSTIVKTIYNTLKTNVSTVLGSDWTELRYLFNIEANDRTTAKKGFGVIPLEAFNDPSVTKAYTLSQTYEIILTRTNVREIDDTDKIDALLDDLYNEASEIFKTVLETNIGLPANVLRVSTPSISAPEFLENYIVLRLQVNVRWREQL
jgi:hypothetical protein